MHGIYLGAAIGTSLMCLNSAIAAAAKDRRDFFTIAIIQAILAGMFFACWAQ